MSVAHEIALALTAKLQQITKANGYATDIGTRVFRGKLALTPSDMPCIVIVEGDDSVLEHTRIKARVKQRYTLEGHAECDAENPNDRAHEIIADLKRAVFNGDLTLGGPVRSIEYRGRLITPREDGFNTVAAGIDIDAEFAENVSAP
jgi:hypothetical protein